MLAFVLTFGIFAVHTHLKHGLNTPPLPGGDSPDYDALGWELAQGHGFQRDFSDSEFRDPYEQAGTADQLPPGQGSETIAYRPPLLPIVMAGANRLYGRQFYAIRLLNIAAMAGVCALAAWTVCGLAGPLPALMVIVNFILVDVRTRVYAREILTESLAAFLVALSAVFLISDMRTSRLLPAATAGVAIGLGLLARSMLALWLPVLALYLIWSARRHGRSLSRGLAHAALFLGAALATASPWMLRNLRVLDGFQPLGTQGAMEASAGYCDAAFARWGVWSNLYVAGDYDEITAGSSGLEREQRIARESARRAKEWALANWWKLPVLAAMKVFSEFRPWDIGELYISAFALLGLIAWRRSDEAAVGWALILAAALAIAVTWSCSGRFLVPLLYVLHAFAAVGLWNSLLAALRRTEHAGLSSEISG
jgi:4-amino-4-deoxy-L-arabinose transferase-like glycosyltransferase